MFCSHYRFFSLSCVIVPQRMRLRHWKSSIMRKRKIRPTKVSSKKHMHSTLLSAKICTTLMQKSERNRKMKHKQNNIFDREKLHMRVCMAMWLLSVMTYTPFSFFTLFWNHQIVPLKDSSKSMPIFPLLWYYLFSFTIICLNRKPIIFRWWRGRWILL